ncbi:tigger transposable element-derived protein 1-like [Watersipora subatra]|uniref:tigger transposable element-derived protein 1-like n=1 Tax=Watersipora subatra TaxID=2589382 RepID=UPI00355B4883
MPPKKIGAISKAPTSEKRKVVRKTIAFKKEIIADYEEGARVSDLAKEYSMVKSTISTILKNKEAVNSKRCGYRRSDFKASREWFEKFKRRCGIHNVVRHGEASSSENTAAEKLKIVFASFVKQENYFSQQIFDCNETGLFWKKMSRRTYITREEKSMPGHKPMKDRFTLLLSLEEDLMEEFDFIKIRFLPPNTTPLLQPVDQKLWPECVTKQELEGFGVAGTSTNAPVEEQKPDLVDDIGSVCKSLGLEIDNDDVEELLKEHQAELTTEKLFQLQNEQKKKLEEEKSSEEEEARKDAPDIRD